jgi:thioredoxin reductase
MRDYDLVVVGGGSAGIWAAPFAARLGAKVALVEKDQLGGDCTHFGCVPSKALLSAASAVWQMRTADRFGVDTVVSRVDLARVMASVRQAIDRVYALETPEALAREGVDVYIGVARFLDPHTLALSDGRWLRARNILLCTGARAAIPAIVGLVESRYWTYETVWQQTQLPERLLIIGSGPVGIELAQAFARLGAQVTVFERGDRPLRRADAEASAVLRQVLEAGGVRFRFGVCDRRAAARLRGAPSSRCARVELSDSPAVWPNCAAHERCPALRLVPKNAREPLLPLRYARWRGLQVHPLRGSTPADRSKRAANRPDRWHDPDADQPGRRPITGRAERGHPGQDGAHVHRARTSCPPQAPCPCRALIWNGPPRTRSLPGASCMAVGPALRGRGGSPAPERGAPPAYCLRPAPSVATKSLLRGTLSKVSTRPLGHSTRSVRLPLPRPRPNTRSFASVAE